MWSAEDLTASIIAAEIYNSKLKSEIFCSSSSSKLQYNLNGNYNDLSKLYWTDNIEEKTGICLKGLQLPEGLRDKIEGIVHSVALKMLNWILYHESVLGISREFCLTFMRSSFFGSYGIIDSEKAAEELMKNESLSVQQKFRLACMYRFSEIPALYYQLREDMSTMVDGSTMSTMVDFGSRSIRQPKLHSIWFNAMEMNDSAKQEYLKSCLLEESIASGSLPAVAFCLHKQIYCSESLVHYALETVRHWVKVANSSPVFIKPTDNTEQCWVPSEYYIDILCLLFTRMSKHEKIVFLKTDLTSRYDNDDEDVTHTRVLEIFLNYPYQMYFLTTAKLMFEFLPTENYAALLLQICDRITYSFSKTSLSHGTEKTFDYRRLFGQFWVLSSEHHKRWFLSNQRVCYWSHHNIKVNAKTGEALFYTLLGTKNCNSDDARNIHLVLSSATKTEKQNIVSTEDWNICIKLIWWKKWRLLDDILTICFETNAERKKIKSEFFVANVSEIKSLCIFFMKNENQNHVDFLLKWIELSADKVIQLKREMLYSENGKESFLHYFKYKGLRSAKRFLRWFNIENEDLSELKESIMYSTVGIDTCEELVTDNKLNLLCDIMDYCLSEEAMMEFKKTFFEKKGCYILKKLISDSYRYSIYNEVGGVIGNKFNFRGGKWLRIEKFLSWYFSSEEEIRDFKKNKLLKTSGAEIHFNLIMAGQFEQAEKFFCWLGLTEKEIKKLKKETLYMNEANELISDIMYDKVYEFAHFGNNQEATALLLRWCLTDEESILEFKDLKFKFCKEIEKDEAVLEILDAIAEQLLIDLKCKNKE